MKFRTRFFIAIVLLIPVLGIAWFSFSTRNQEPVRVFPATIKRDCAPWDGAAFMVSIPVDVGAVIDLSIWRSPDEKLPVIFSFPDQSGRIGIAVYRSRNELPEQLSGTVILQRVAQGIPVGGRFDLVAASGGEFKGRFKAIWGDQIALCG